MATEGSRGVWLAVGGALALGAAVLVFAKRGAPVYHQLRAEGADPRLRAFLAWWERNGAFPICVAPDGGRRTSEATQAALYARGASKAKTLAETPHGRGGALDVCPYDEARRVPLWEGPGVTAKFLVIGAAAKANGLEWGGDWMSLKDMPHVQVPDWKRLAMGGVA